MSLWIEAPANADLCDTFSATVNISQVSDFDSASYDITYDPDILQVTGVNNGSIGGTVIPVNDWGFIPVGVQGTVRIVNNAGGVGGVSGAGVLAVIDFSVSCVNCGNTTIDFSGEHVVYDNQSIEINSAWAGDWTNVSCAVPTPSPTATASTTATPSASATPTPSPTATATVFTPWVHFSDPVFNTTTDTGFWTPVELDPSDMVSNISYFWGAQFDVVYDYNLINARPLLHTKGSLYDVNTGNWTVADFSSVSYQGTGPGGEGRIRIQVDWRTYPSGHGSTGMTTNGGTLINLRWRSTASTGVTDLSFVEFKALVGYGPPPAVEWEIAPALWTNSSVNVQ